jgi:hypothetical protein
MPANRLATARGNENLTVAIADALCNEEKNGRIKRAVRRGC